MNPKVKKTDVAKSHDDVGPARVLDPEEREISRLVRSLPNDQKTEIRYE